MNLPPIMTVGQPMPASLGRSADLYHDIREIRLAMEKDVAELKARESEVENHIIANLSVGQDTGAAGLKYRAQVISKRKPKLSPDGWEPFFTWVNKHGYLNMIQKRIGDVAVQEWIDDPINQQRVPPGLEMIVLKSLSVTKI